MLWWTASMELVTYKLCMNIPSIRIQNRKGYLLIQCHTINLTSHVPHCWWWEPGWPLTPQTRRLVGACPSTLLPCRHVLEREREGQTSSCTWREFLICTLLPGFYKANLGQWRWWAGQFLGEYRRSHWCSSLLWLLPSESESALPAHNVGRPWWYDLDHCEYVQKRERMDVGFVYVHLFFGPYFSIQLALSAASARVAAQ